MEAGASSSKDISFQIANHNANDTIIAEDKKKDPGGIWKCFCCTLEEHYDYKGSKPPFAKYLSFLEDSYIMKDPFSSVKGEILVLGADCSICESSVCMECSFFYAKRFCKVCALKHIEHFPLKLKSKIMRLNKSNEEEM